MTLCSSPPAPRPWLLALTSTVLLIVAFPRFNQPWAAWVALVPWLLLLRRATRRAAFWWSYAIGGVFFLGSLWWLIHVTVIGWLVLCAYLALFFGLFGLTVAWVFIPHSAFRIPHFLIPPLWVSFEYLRSHLLSGFGWNLLAYSQAPWPAVIQVADITGAWGISFVIVWMNALVADVIHTITVHSPQSTVHRQTEHQLALQGTVMVGIVITMLGYGMWRIRHLTAGLTVRVAVVQGNIPQEQKWDEASQEGILRRYEALTRAAADTHPDLIVWPETSVPGYLGLEDALTTRVTDLARAVHVPLVVGAPRVRLEEGRVANAAALLTADGAIAQWHEKLHLVPFGEFIPGESLMPWFRQVLPPIGDFVPGTEFTVFSTPGRRSKVEGRRSHVHLPPSTFHLPFSVLICFEDIFPGLSRRFVRDGARLLLVITNDAWFGPTAAAYQHTQASIVRAVELRVPVVRAANTGWSGCIDAAGRIHGSVRDPAGRELFVEGTQTCPIRLGDTLTPYARLGDWLPLTCLFLTVAWSCKKCQTLFGKSPL